MTNNIEEILNLRVRAFRPMDDINLCNKYIEGHSEVLKIFGITEITSANTDWFYNPASFAIIAEDIETGEIIGGGRIHMSDTRSTQPLPIEDAVGYIDSEIYTLVNSLSKYGTGELCGLWNSRKVAGKGVSFVLTRALVALVKQLSMDSVFIICAESTYQRIFKQTGFSIENSLGDNGKFYYPKSDLVALTLLIENTLELNYANSYIRKLILDLRENPKQIRKETGNNGNQLSIDYDILLPKVWDQ